MHNNRLLTSFDIFLSEQQSTVEQNVQSGPAGFKNCAFRVFYSPAMPVEKWNIVAVEDFSESLNFLGEASEFADVSDIILTFRQVQFQLLYSTKVSTPDIAQAAQFLIVEQVMLFFATLGLIPCEWHGFKRLRETSHEDIKIEFKQQDYQIRVARKGDGKSLARIEKACWDAPLQLPKKELKKRITRYPEGQLVLVKDGRVVGVLYSQRIDSVALLNDVSIKNVAQLHSNSGEILQFLSINVLTEPALSGVGYVFFEFALALARARQFKQAVAVSLCKQFNGESLKELETYIHDKDTNGVNIDPILKFHALHGAQVVRLVKGFRSKDTKNLGCGVLVSYKLDQDCNVEQNTPDGEQLANRPQLEILSLLHQYGEKPFLQEADLSRSFSDLGLESMHMLSLSAEISRLYSVSVTPVDFFKYSTPSQLQAFVRNSISSGKKNTLAAQKSDVHNTLKPHEPDAGADKDGLQNIDSASNLAIVGLAVRLPGANNLEEFSQLLQNKSDAVGRLRDIGDEAQLRTLAPDTQGGFLTSISDFDARFFGVSPKEARFLDPQQRLLLETVWEALEHAGISPDDIPKMHAGIFVGAFNHDYQFLQLHKNQGARSSPYFWSGNSASMLAGRLAYFLGSTGPALTIDTACSASLVALHQAGLAIRNGDCDVAIVAGVNLILSDEVQSSFEQAGMLSEQARCKSFDASADGYVRSEGCCVVILRLSADAIESRHRVYAEVLSTAVNQDGASNGLTAPNAIAQAELIARAMKKANIRPDEIDYVEAHGTGTPLGDPIEFEALQSVFCDSTSKRLSPLLVGSVKSNIGHTEAAAGLTSLVKVVLALENSEIPANLHFTHANPLIDLNAIPAHIPVVGHPWPKTDARRRVAGINSFGFSGTNAHALIAEPVNLRSDVSEDSGKPHVIMLSADNVIALSARARALHSFLSANSSPKLSDLAFTLSAGRSHRSKRVAAVCSSIDELNSTLEHWSGEISAGKFSTVGKAYAVAFTCTGQGSQYVSMGLELYNSEPVIRHWLDRAEAQSREFLPASLLTVMFEGNSGPHQLHHTLFAQPAIFTLQVALTELLRSWGITPTAVLGHSLGEYVAAYTAGVMSFDDAFSLVLRRAALMQSMPAGAMTSVFVSESAANALIQSAQVNLSVAVINTADSVVVSGPIDQIELFERSLDDQGAVYSRLNVSHANHSFMFDPVMPKFEKVLENVSLKLPRLPFYSSMTGKIESEKLIEPSYWVQQLRQPVRFYQAAMALASQYQQRLEVGALPILSQIGRSAIEQGHWDALAGSSGVTRQSVMHYLADAFTLGAPINWNRVHTSNALRMLALSSYPFSRKPYWFDEIKQPFLQSTNDNNETVEMSAHLDQPLSSRTMRDYYAGLRDRVAESGDSTDVKAISGRIRFAPFERPLDGFTWLPTFLGSAMNLSHQTAIQSAHDHMLNTMFGGLNLQKVNHAVDIGCGYGTDVLELAARHPHMTINGHNISTEQIDFARERACKMGLQDRVSFDWVNSCSDTFARTYDLAWSFQVVHHQQDKFPLFKNVSNSLVNGGYFVLAEILSAEPDAIDHIESSAYFSPVNEWAELLSEAGFRVEQAIDASAEIANYLTDENFERNLAELAAGADENTLKHLRGPHDLGRLLSKGFTKYMLISARKDSMANIESLLHDNMSRLHNPQPYSSVAQRLSHLPSNQQAVSSEKIQEVAHPVANSVDRSQTPESYDPGLRNLVAKILEIRPDELDPNVTLVRQGLNSLMAMEIRRELKRSMGIDFAIRSLLGDATLVDIQAGLTKLGQSPLAARERQEPQVVEASSTATVVSAPNNVESLSETEVDALILRLLETTPRQ